MCLTMFSTSSCAVIWKTISIVSCRSRFSRSGGATSISGIGSDRLLLAMSVL